jgi:hypothetical protein
VQRYVTWKTKGRLRCGLSEAKREIGLMEDFFFYAQRRGGRKPAEELRRRRHEETVTGAINLPPP